MKHILAFFFIFCAIPLHADLNTAFTDFEMAEKLLLESASSEGRRAVIQADCAKALFQKAADELMIFRKKGATIPIAYLEYMKKKGFAKIDEDIRWDEIELQKIKQARQDEAEDKYKFVNIAFPMIPDELLNESQEHFETSRKIADYQSGESHDKLATLFSHYMNSKSSNLRAFWFLLTKTKTPEKRPPSLRRDQAFKVFIKINRGRTKSELKRKIEDFLNTYRKKEKLAIDTFWDPKFTEMILAFNPMVWKNIEANSTYEEGNSEGISKHHMFEAVEQDNHIPDYMTAFQHGAVPCEGISAPFLGGVEYKNLSVLDMLSFCEFKNSMLSAYFSFLNIKLFDSDIGHRYFMQRAQPVCSLYTYPQKFFVYDENITAEEAFERSIVFQHIDKKLSRKHLKLAAKKGHFYAAYHHAKHLAYNKNSATDRKIGIRKLQTLLARNNITAQQSIRVKAHLANLYVLTGIGDPHESFEYAKSALKFTTDDYAENVPAGILAYFLARGIGCKKNMGRAKKILKKDENAAWSFFVNIKEEINLINQETDFEKAMNLFVAKMIELKLIENSGQAVPTPLFFFEEIMHCVKKHHRETKEMSKVELVMFFMALSDIREGSDFSQALLVAKELQRTPGILSGEFEKYNIRGKSSPRYFTELAIAHNDQEAPLFKAECILKKREGFTSDDREADLTEALQLVRQHRRRNIVADRVLERRIQNELATLHEEPQQLELEGDEGDDASTESDSDDEYGKAKAECDDILNEAIARSKAKKEEQAFTHAMQMPEQFEDKSDDEGKIFKVSENTMEFVNMVYGFGETRIHHYDVDAASAIFKDLGFEARNKAKTDWQYQDQDGIIHKLSYHPPHGREENKLYNDIRTRFKRFFIKIDLTPDTVELK